jgi:hypothetical protein
LKEEKNQMTAAQLVALADAPVGEDESVRCWRFEELLRAGYDEDDATEIAFDLEIDLHLATTLVSRGCSSELAAQIVL